jgi:hypothetical protein
LLRAHRRARRGNRPLVTCAETLETSPEMARNGSKRPLMRN